jgi:hypothetical protein
VKRHLLFGYLVWTSLAVSVFAVWFAIGMLIASQT